jgi:hypothetical protein
MRLLLAVLFCLASLLGFLNFYPQYIPQGKINAFNAWCSDKWQEQMYQRHYTVSGVSLLKTQRIEDLLPHSGNKELGSNLLLRFNSTKYLEPIYDIPLVKKAKFEPCHFYTLNCFHIEITEKTPSFITTLKDTIWLVAEDGGFILSLGKVNDSLRLKKAREQLKLPLVYGLESNDAVPTIVQARALYVNKMLTSIKSSLDLKINSAEFVNDGELLVWLQNYPFQIQFSSSFNNDKNIVIELARLKKVLSEIDSYKHAIQKIDLAFDKQVVLKLTDQAVEARASINSRDPKIKK